MDRDATAMFVRQLLTDIRPDLVSAFDRFISGHASAGDVDEIEQVLADELVMHGFTEAWVTNEKGKALEASIGWLVGLSVAQHVRD